MPWPIPKLEKPEKPNTKNFNELLGVRNGIVAFKDQYFYNQERVAELKLSDTDKQGDHIDRGKGKGGLNQIAGFSWLHSFQNIYREMYCENKTPFTKSNEILFWEMV